MKLIKHSSDDYTLVTKEGQELRNNLDMTIRNMRDHGIDYEEIKHSLEEMATHAHNESSFGVFRNWIYSRGR